jgi:SAM-dependent methyltransferase
MPIAEFDDPRLAAIYDTVNTHDPDEQPRFVRRLVDQHAAATTGGSITIVDVGCGTGLITRELAGLGHRVIGVDPSAEMIGVGRTGPHGDRVEWVVGGVDAVGTSDADLAIMTSHVAQFFVDDDEWLAALHVLHDALRDGGRLGFESRNPGAREWERWTPAIVTTVTDPDAGRIDWWTEVHDVRDGVVSYANHYRFEATGDEVLSSARLRFRTEDELRTSLHQAGFTVERIDGWWDGRPSGPTEREHIVVARR